MKPVEQLWSTVSRSVPSVRAAFAYGSGVFAQESSKMGDMVDFVFLVDDVDAWHKENISRNPEHYSFMSALGSSHIARLQRALSADVYFNPYVRTGDGQTIKYGVASISFASLDLRHWNKLYLAGRLQKPVLFLKGYHDLESDFIGNLNATLDVASICLPHKVHEEILFQFITGISYHGDIRMLFAENPKKIENIARGSLSEFRTLYRPVFSSRGSHMTELNGGIIEFNKDPIHLAEMFHRLPSHVLKGIAGRSIASSFSASNHPALFHRIGEQLGSVVADSLKDIVRKSSIQQTTLGLFSAGISKSFTYSLSKVSKKIKSNS